MRGGDVSETQNYLLAEKDFPDEAYTVSQPDLCCKRHHHPPEWPDPQGIPPLYRSTSYGYEDHHSTG